MMDVFFPFALFVDGLERLDEGIFLVVALLPLGECVDIVVSGLIDISHAKHFALKQEIVVAVVVHLLLNQVRPPV